MTVYRYDGTWTGLLCALFQAYEQLRLHPDAPRPRVLATNARGRSEMGMFETAVAVESDEALARRVLAGLQRHGSARMPGRLYRAFLSEAGGVEGILLDYLDALGDYGAGIEHDHTLDAVRTVERLARRVNREVHHLHAFVRFEAVEEAAIRGAGSAVSREAGCLWWARVSPACNVLPLAGDHFRTRYPAQRWVIVDERRGSALIWDTRALRLTDAAPAPPSRRADGEMRFQALWRAYFEAVDIPERRNPALQQRHLPLRYRRGLPELLPRAAE